MDEDLQRLLRERQYEPAFNSLLERYQRKVFHLALCMLRNPAGAEDAAQEVFLRIWRALPYYNESAAALSTWIFTIARNTCLSQIRSNSIRSALSLTEPAVWEVVEARQQVKPQQPNELNIRQAVDGLAERNREVLSLYYFREKSYEEVAEILGIPLGTVKSYLHRAKKALAETMRAPNVKEREERR